MSGEASCEKEGPISYICLAVYRALCTWESPVAQNSAYGNTKERVMNGFTSRYEVDRLLYWESFDDVRKAIDREKQLKRLATGKEDRLD